VKAAGLLKVIFTRFGLVLYKVNLKIVTKCPGDMNESLH